MVFTNAPDCRLVTATKIPNSPSSSSPSPLVGVLRIASQTKTLQVPVKQFLTAPNSNTLATLAGLNWSRAFSVPPGRGDETPPAVSTPISRSFFVCLLTLYQSTLFPANHRRRLHRPLGTELRPPQNLGLLLQSSAASSSGRAYHATLQTTRSRHRCLVKDDPRGGLLFGCYPSLPTSLLTPLGPARPGFAWRLRRSSHRFYPLPSVKT